MIDPNLYYSNNRPSEGQDLNNHVPQHSAVDIYDLFADKRRISRTKLEMFAAEIFERLRLRTVNLGRLDRARTDLYAMLHNLDRQARYRMREHQEKRVLYELLFKAKQEERLQDVECWRDIVLVMRDFLNAWDAHEQMQARAIFLDHAGSRT